MLSETMTSSVTLRAVLVYHVTMLLSASESKLLSSSDAVDCPPTCFCNALSRIVYCSRRGLDAIPTRLPQRTVQLNVNGNHFRSRALQRANFSTRQAATIEHLYLSDCAIETLEVNTFADLSRLRWLDLSDNRLRDIPPGAFYSLALQHLFLNGNNDIRLLPGSFDGLVTSGLYLHDCALEVLPPETLSPLNGTLVNLWLNGNRLRQFDGQLSTMFSQLSHLRLGANPLHCGCASLWLKQLYDRHGGATFRGAEPPTCWTPARLRARHFDQLTSADMRCNAPSFGNIDAQLDWRGTGRLRCEATGQPTPTIYWIRPSGRTRRYDVQTAMRDDDSVMNVRAARRDDNRRNEGVVWFSQDEGHAGLYVCVASNEVGNVTLTVNLSWPAPAASTSSSSSSSSLLGGRMTSLTNSLPLPRHHSPTVSVINLMTGNEQPEAEVQTRVVAPDIGYHRRPEVSESVRLFTVSELAAAVVGTHLCTVLVFFLLLLPVHVARVARRKSRQPADSPQVCDSLLNKSALVSTHTANTVSCHRWPPRLDYAVS